MTSEEREACADLYLFLTNGDLTMPIHRWNDAAAVELYEMIKVLKNCTRGMEWIKSTPNLIPKNSISTSIAAVKYLLGIWRTKISIEAKLKMGKISPICKSSHMTNHMFLIQRAAYGLGVQ
jgi:hypothetical protein